MDPKEEKKTAFDDENTGQDMAMGRPKKTVTLANYSEGELACSCGCGKTVSDEYLIRLQAFILILERVMGAKVRHIVTGGARCEKRQREIYMNEVSKKWRITDKDQTPTSMHQGPNRVDEGLPGEADDGYYQVFKKGKWSTIPNTLVAKHARHSKLFGGVIHAKYAGSTNHIHKDSRKGSYFA